MPRPTLLHNIPYCIIVIHICTYSVYWEHYYSLGHYGSVVPSHVPRIIDPANPSNNLYDTGIGYYCANEKSCDFEQGDGDWTAFKKTIHTVDLTKPMEHWIWL